MVKSQQDFVDVIAYWRMAAETKGLSVAEMAVCAAQFAGLCVGNSGLSSEHRSDMLSLLARAMNTACEGRIAVKEGYGRPVTAARAANDVSPIQ